MNPFPRLRWHVPGLWLLAALIAATGLAAAGAPPAPTEVIVPGTPPLTFLDVANHVRLLELVVGHRATRAQQDRFLEAVRQAGRAKDPRAREALVQARELVQSMAGMGDGERATVRRLLHEDFTATARTDEADPAARLFLELQDKSARILVGTGTSSMSEQAVDAFAEYLAGSGGKGKPAAWNAARTKQLIAGLTALWPRLPAPARAALAAFDQTWYLMRAAPVAHPAVARPAGPPDLGPADLEPLIRPEVWQQQASAAAALGQTAAGWPADPSNIVW
ncbi:MAG: hypothetical protein GX442_14275 [Candidatus Riflebacteria bacterium]|nr:hypothetical protein [Candidatus Riflebacteria bacterium]